MRGPQPRMDFGWNQLGQKIPGYIAPPQEFVTVKDGSKYPSVESKLQLTVQQLVGNFVTQTMTDADVKQKLQDDADSVADYNRGFDSGVNSIPSLVDFYLKVFRAAVTPLPNQS